VVVQPIVPVKGLVATIMAAWVCATTIHLIKIRLRKGGVGWLRGFDAKGTMRSFCVENRFDARMGGEDG